MQKYLPSKQFVRLILIALALALLVFILGKILNKKTVWQNKSLDEKAVSNSNKEDFFSVDSDGDGLYDWEEALWETNPKLKDSDGDGVDDKKFIENKRKDADFDETYKSNPDNETEVFAKQFFTTAAVLNQSGSFNQDTIDNFSSGISQSIENFTLKDKYTLSDLKLGNISFEQYKKNISDIYERVGTLEFSELTIIAFIIENPNDEDGLNELGKYLAYSDSLIKGYLSTNVPNSNIGLHLSFINNLDKISEIMKNSIYIDDDPLKVATYLSKYDEYSTKLLKDINALKNYFSSNGII